MREGGYLYAEMRQMKLEISFWACHLKESQIDEEANQIAYDEM